MPAARVSGTVRSKNPLKGAVEILPERLYYAALKSPPVSHNILATTPRRKKSAAADNGAPQQQQPKKQIHFFNVDNTLVYWNFFLDFGPLNMGQLARFCKKLNDKLRKFPVVCFYSNTVPAKRANAIFLICAWQLLYLNRSPDECYRGFDAALQREIDSGSRPPLSKSQGAVTIAPVTAFHDASPCECTYDLTVLDCLRGIAKARQHDFFEDLEHFDVEEYEHYEQVENGDLNWLVKDKILAFAGPSYEKNISPEGYCTLAPSDYIPYFQQKNVGLVVRLNKKNYNEQDFVNAGIDHMEAYFLDGSCPPMKTLYRVLAAFEAVPAEKAFAVHCKAGLGRTGTCIGAYLMKHYRFTAAEAIAWMRICRPGCVIGPQQHFLKQIESRMWEEGAAVGQRIPRPPLSMSSSPTTPKTRREDNNVLSPPASPRMTLPDEEMHDAVEGRVGQAEALLAARERKHNHNQHHHHHHDDNNNNTVKPSAAAVLPTPPITPEQSSKDTAAVTVTPESAAQSRLWCG